MAAAGQTTAPPQPVGAPPGAPPPPVGEPPGGADATAAAAGSANVNDWQIVPVDTRADIVVAQSPDRIQFRIGSKKNRFVYVPSDFTFRDHPVYQCMRGSDTAMGQYGVYWLYRCSSGWWMCVEAHMDSDDPIRDGSPQFKTESNSIDDISVEREYLAWQHWDELWGKWSDGVVMSPTRRVPMF